MTPPWSRTVRTVALAILSAVLVALEAPPSWPAPPITPPAGHPRLFLRPGDLPAMRQRTTDPFFARAWRQLQEQAAQPFTGALAAEGANYDARIHAVAEADALCYLLADDAAAGQRAVAIIRRALPAVRFPEQQDITRAMGATILTAALVYDWCWPLLDGADRTLVITHMKRIARLMEIGYPPTRQGAVTGHGGEAQLMRDQLGAGIAVYDEDGGIYRHAAGRFFAEFVPVRSFIYPAHWHHQGSDYGAYRFQWEMFASWMLTRMGAAPVFTPDQGQVPYAWVYARRPDGQLLCDGDVYTRMPKGQVVVPQPDLGTFLAAHFYRDPVLAGIIARQSQEERGRGLPPLWFLLFADPRLEPAAVAGLPLSRFFPDPAGVLIARTGWEEGPSSAAVVCQMKLGTWMFNNHQHLDAGHFQIYYQGLLAADSGIYQGSLGGYGSDHDRNYNKRTVAHNCVLVRDPAERPRFAGNDVANDGGQCWPAQGREASTLEMLQRDGHQVGRVIAQAMGPDARAPLFSHAAVDLTNAYGGKVARYTRSFVFLNLLDPRHPAALIVHDRVRAAQPSFPKTWLFHCLDQPRCDGEGFHVTGVHGGHLDGTVLLPRSGGHHLEVVGGEGRAFWVDGRNWPQMPKKGVLSEVENAGWRIELTPTTAQRDDAFLVVMQVQDGTAPPLTVTPMSGPGWTGARIADRVVILPDQDGFLTAPMNLDIAGTAAVHCLVTGAAAGSWIVHHAGGETRIGVTDGGHELAARVSPGAVSVKLAD